MTSPEVKAAIADLRNQAASSADFEQPITTDVSSDRTVAQVSIPLAGDGSDSQSTAALAALRDRIDPGDDRSESRASPAT